MPDRVPAGHVSNTSPSVADDQATAHSALAEAASTPVEEKVAVNTNTDWENGVPIAHDLLHEIGEKLKKLPSDLLASGDFEINSSADVNSLSENIGPAVMTLKQRNVDRSW